MSDLVPEEAIAAAAAALELQQVDADDPRAWFRGHAEGAVRAAAPLILAGELDRMARAIDNAPYPFEVLEARAAELRASGLRGEGDRDG